MANSSTIGIDHFARSFQLSDRTLINFLIYDTCGQEKYNSINETYYKKADAILLVYDISSKKSFIKLKEYFIPKIKDFCQNNITTILLGNKTDLEEIRQVTSEEGIDLAKQEQYIFLESSCIRNINVANAFEVLVETWNFKNYKSRNSNYNSLIQKDLLRYDNKANADSNPSYSFNRKDNPRINPFYLNKKKHKNPKKLNFC